MTGRRLLIYKLSYGYTDFGPTWYRKSMNNCRKKWSKLSRRFLEKELDKELLEYNISTNIRH